MKLIIEQQTFSNHMYFKNVLKKNFKNIFNFSKSSGSLDCLDDYKI